MATDEVSPTNLTFIEFLLTSIVKPDPKNKHKTTFFLYLHEINKHKADKRSIYEGQQKFHLIAQRRPCYTDSRLA